jgi:hypothetical protein
VYAGPEYWYVIYKAIADFGDLKKGAAEAVSDLKAMETAAKALSTAEVAGSTQAAAARAKDVASIQQETQALSQLAASAKQTNVQLLYGGRNDMTQHLSDMSQELNYTTLLNRQKWLGFSSVQQAMSYRQQMYNLALLENKAHFAGYLTADQYLGFLQRETMQTATLSAAIRDRSSAIAAETAVLLAHTNALQGTHQTVGSLGEQLTSAGVYAAALTGVPSVVSTRALFDDSQALGQLAAYRAALLGLPRAESTDITATATRLGGIPFTGGRVPVEVTPEVEGAAPAGLAAAARMMEQFRRASDEPVRIPVEVEGVTQDLAEVEALHSELKILQGEVIESHLELEGGPAEIADLAAVRSALDAIPEEKHTVVYVDGLTGDYEEMEAFTRLFEELPREEIKPEFDGSEVETGLHSVVGDLMDAVRKKYEFEAGLDDTELLGELDTVESRMLTAEEQGKALMSLLGQGGAGGGGGGGGPPPASGAADEPDPDEYAALRDMLAQVDALFKNTSRDSAAAAGGLKQAGAAAQAMVDPLVASTGGWFGLNSQLRVFGGLLGTVSAWHVVLDFIIEGIAVFLPAIVTLIAGLTAFGIAGSDAAVAVYNRLMAIHTASDALNATIPPMTGNLEKLHDQVRPQVWELYGDAIDVVHNKTGLFSQLAIQTGDVLDRFAARVTVDLTSGSKGLETFLGVGSANLAKLGTFFDNIGQALLAFIKVTQETHVDQIFLSIFVALSQLLVLVTKLPTPLLAAAVGLHAFWLWGGLLATVVMQMLNPLRSLALALGAVDAAGVEGGLASLTKDASAFEKLKAGLTDIGAGLGAIPARFGLFTKSAGEAATAAEDVGAATEDAGAAAGEAAVAGGGLASVFARLGPALSNPVGLLGALAVGLAGAYTYLALLPDPTQKWINSLNQALAKTTAFTVVSQTVGDLAAVTQQLAKAQETGTGNATELAGAQRGLSTDLGNELTHVGQVSKAYGTDFVGALELLNTAGVKTSDIFSAQGKTWEADLQQVKGLVAGYAAMGQGLSALQNDVSVQLVNESDQVTAMGKLNTAWDTWIKTVGGTPLEFISLAQGLATFTQDAAVAGASMTGLGAASITLQNDFQTSYNNVEGFFDAFRNDQALTGEGNFTQFVKDAVAELIPMAGGSKEAAAQISALAQEAGGPATDNIKTLQQWVGNIKDPLEAMYKASNDAAIGASSLSQDAARLTSSLQSDLNPAMSSAIFNAHGGQAVFNQFADALAKTGPSSAATATAAHNVARELLAITGNSASAKANFVGFGEAMGLSAKQASALWAQVTAIPKDTKTTYELEATQALKDAAKLQAELPGLTGKKKLEVEAQIKDLELQAMQDKLKAVKGNVSDLNNASLSKLRGQLAETASSAANIVKPGEVDTILSSFKTGTFFELTFLAWIPQVQRVLTIINHDVGQFFTHDLPEAAVTGGHAFEAAWDGMVNWFTQSVPHGLETAWDTVSSFLDKSFTHDIPAAWDTAWANVASPVAHAFDDVKTWVSSNFDTWWKTHGSAVEAIWNATWGQIRSDALGAWHFIESDATTAWRIITGIFTSGPAKQVWAGFSGAATDTWHFIESEASAAWAMAVTGARGAWNEITALAKAAWDLVVGAGKAAWDLLWAFAGADAKGAADALVGIFKAAWALVLAAGKVLWDTLVVIVDEFLDLITGHWSTAWKDMESYGIQVWNALKNAGIQVWNALSTAAAQVWNAIWTALKTGGTQAWNALKTGGQQAWSAIWHSLQVTVINPMASFFAAQVPKWWDSFANFASQTWGKVWSGFNTDVLKPIEGFFTSTLPNAMWNSLKGGIDHVISGLNTVIGWINSVTSVVGIHIGTIPTLAHGGPVHAVTGSVPGTGDEDGTHIVAMGGEYMLRKPARMALQAAYGPDFLDELNHADTWLGAGSRGNAASQQGSGRGRYASGGGILGNIANWIGDATGAVAGAASAAWNGITGAAQDVAKFGEKAVFDAMWTTAGVPAEKGLEALGTPGDMGAAWLQDIHNGVETWMAGQTAKAQSAAAASTPAAGTGGGIIAAMMKNMAAERGWTGAQWSALYDVEEREAGFSMTAQNPTSDAYGLAQFIDGASEYAQYGGNSTTATGQITAMLNYIAQRYGTPEGAWAHEEAYGWYAGGGPVMTAIQAATADRDTQEALAVGSWLLTKLNAAGSAPSLGEYGAWLVNLSKHRGFTQAMAQDPTKAVRLVLPAYSAGVSGAGAAAWKTSAARAAAQAAASASASLGTRWSSPSTATLTQGWNAIQSDLAPAPAQVAAQAPSGDVAAYQADAARLYPDWEGALNPWKTLNTWTTRPSGVSAADWATWLTLRTAIENRVSVAGSYIAPLFDDLKVNPQELTGAMWSAANSNVRRWQAAMDLATLAKAKKTSLYSPIQSNLTKFQTDVVDAYNAWHGIWGTTLTPPPGSTSGGGTGDGGGTGGGTSGPGTGPGGSTGSVVIDLAPLIPGTPKAPSGGTMGFTLATGGEVPSLSSVAGMFGGGMAGGGLVPNLFVPGMSATLSRQLSAAASGELPRTMADAAAVNRTGLHVDSLTINNPRPERPSDSIIRSSNRLAVLAGRGMVLCRRPRSPRSRRQNSGTGTGRRCSPATTT